MHSRATLKKSARQLWRMLSDYNELFTLLLVLLLAAGVWAFVEITDEVLEGETRQIDKAVLLALRSPDDLSDPIGPKWLEEIGRDVTALGGVAILAFITMASAAYLVLMRKPHAALFVLIAVGSGFAVSQSLKGYFDRPRPDLVPHGSIVYTSSFPSGHSMLSATTYLTLAALLARVQPSRRLKAYLLSLAVVLTVAVGVSRVYLGVHWPTDVLAGWTAGATWAVLCWLIARWLQRKGTVEPETNGEPGNS